MSASNCTQFRPHHLRPEKCRGCFGDKSRHQQQQQQPAESSVVAPTEATSEKRQQTTPTAGDNNKGDCDTLTREELLSDLRRCHEERTKLRASNEQNCDILREKSQLIDGYKVEIERLKSQLNECLESRKPSAQSPGDHEKLKSELEAMRSRLESAERQRDQAREELRTLEKEMEEMHDNFKEEESEQFEQLKQELDLATKNCKILQIRLNKAERQYGQLEQVKSMLEHQLEEWTNRHGRPSHAQELNHSAATATSGGSFVQMGDDFVKIASREYDQLLRDLNDTIEREKDLQEQIKYSQEEAQMKSDRLQAVEAENEVLLSKVNKLTLANSRLRSNPMRCASMERSDSVASNEGGSAAAPAHQQQVSSSVGSGQSSAADVGDLIQQNEQLKLALDLAQSESERLRHKCQELVGLVEARESSLKECEARIGRLEEELAQQSSTGADQQVDQQHRRRPAGELAKLELECRHLRTRLVHSERECKQLKAELSEGRPAMSKSHGSSDHRRALSHSLSMESGSSELAPAEQAKLREIVRQLREECNSLKAQNKELEARLEQLSTDQNVGGTKMESDLLEKLKCQLEASENELAKTKSRLVELDLDHGRLQRQHKRLVESAANGSKHDQQSVVARKVRLPPEQQRDVMSRQELRRLLKELEAETDELVARLGTRDSLQMIDGGRDDDEPCRGQNSTETEQVKSLRRLLDQERLLSNNLKLDIGQLEQAKLELQTGVQMLERERVAMEEELDKLRQVNSELELNLEEAKRNHRAVSGRLKDSQLSNEKLRDELNQLRSSVQPSAGSQAAVADESSGGSSSPSVAQSGGGDLLLLMRDLSELKVKNGFLMRQLEVAREDSARQLEELRQAHELQQRRAVELAQLELKERHLAEGQQLRDELNELKQRLAQSQRQSTRNEEEAAQERDRLRSMERDWRRDKSQWQQRLEQLEAQLSIERRSNEYKSKEWESLVRDKERELISVQDRYVQLERDLKRLQNKYSLLEEGSESKQKNLERDLEVKKRELSDLMAINQKREDEYYENCKRFNNERATLMETLESLRRSYDEKLAELKSSRELLALRQEQSYKERLASQEQVEQLGDQLLRMSEHEGQAKLLRQQLQVQERHLESLRREQGQLKEERTRLKGRCEELERRCQRYEKQELITKTSHISASSSVAGSFLRNPFHSQSGQQKPAHSSRSRPQDEESGAIETADPAGKQSDAAAEADQRQGQCMMVEKLTSKINDQRHLINMLKQQNEELQLEVRQLRLIQSSDKSRWQGRVAQLQSRLNACEERLLFETQLLNRDTFEGARRKLEVQWAEERQMSLDTIQQQQAQNEILTRDLRKLGQAHELLRLQSKQLESHNNKLSRRLIEYQQQQQQFHLGSSTSERELEACLARQEQLIELNSRLINLMKEEAKPLVETVTKMVAALDVSEPASKQQSEQLLEAAEQVADSSDSSRPNSTQRPLHMTTGTLERGAPDLSLSAAGKSAAQPQKSTTSQSSSRVFARLLGKQPKTNEPETSTAESSTSKGSAANTKTATKIGTKRVRVKSSSLGITLAEKKQLKRHLEQLHSAIDELNALKSAAATSAARSNPAMRSNEPFGQQDRSLRASSSPVEDMGPTAGQQPATVRTLGQRPHSFSQQRDSDSGSAAASRVHWQLQGDDSDVESNRSWSAADSSNTRTGKPLAGPTNLYRRFPQSTPASYGASLTDYESESSLASYDDLSTTYSPRRFASGAESDSALGNAGHQQPTTGGKLKTGLKKRTLKTRLTSTLRNISRSITGLASDSEADSVDASSSRSRPIRSRGRKQAQLDVMGANDNDKDDVEGVVREIRV